MPILPVLMKIVQSSLVKGAAKAGVASAAGKSFGEHYTADFAKGVGNAMSLRGQGVRDGQRLVNGFKQSVTRLFFEIPKEVSKRRWGEHLAGALVKTTGARLASMNANLAAYGGSAQTYAHTMTALADKAFKLGFGEANWIPQLMKYTLGEYDPFGSGENGWKTKEENLEWFKDRYNGRKDLTDEARTVGGILGITPDIVKLILDGHRDLLERENHLTDKQVRASENLAYQEARAEAAKQEFFDILGANFSPLGTAVESFKESVFKFGVDIMKGGKRGPGDDWNNLSPEEKAARALSNPIDVKRYKDEGVSEAELFNVIKKNGGKSRDLLSAAELLGLEGDGKYATILARYNGFFKNNGIVGNYDPSLFTSQSEIERLRKADQLLENAKRIRTDGYLYDPNMSDEQIKQVFDDITTRFSRGELLRENDLSFLGALNGRKGTPYVNIALSTLQGGVVGGFGSLLGSKWSHVGLQDPSNMSRDELDAYIKMTEEALAARQKKKEHAIEAQRGLLDKTDNLDVDLDPSQGNDNSVLEYLQKARRSLKNASQYYDLPVSPTGINMAAYGLGGGSYERTYNNNAYLVVNNIKEAMAFQSRTLDEADAWLNGGTYEPKNENILTATAVG